jgi:ATP-binding cassette subfamily B protein
MLNALRPLFPYFRRYRTGYLLGTICVLGTNVIWVLFPLVLGHAVQDISQNVTREKILHYSLQLIAIVVAKGIFQFLTRWIVIGVSRDIEFDLRNDLFLKLESLSFSYYQRTRTGDIMARATNDLNAVRMLLGPAIMYSGNTIALTVMALAFMLSISPRLTLFAFVPLPVVSIIVQYFGRRIHERFERIQAQFSDISARAQENFSGARVVRAYAQEEPEIELFETSNREYVARSLKLVRLMGMLWPTLQLMLGAAIVIVLWVGGQQVIRHEIKLQGFVSFTAYMAQLTWPVIATGWVVNMFQRGTASMLRISEILNEQPEIHDAGAAAPLPEPRGDIEFRHLTFSYDGRSVLEDVNLRIPAGTSLAIVGPTGSGKSTLVNLIPRIYDAAPGAVLLDGRPLRDWPLDTLRRNIGFIPQETFLFGATVGENIALGVEDASLDSIRQAAEAAYIDSDIRAFSDQYDTLVGERGITLSGGQKQRTAIARALIRNPHILILDDALSSVDTQTEDHILNHLREIMRDRTTIFISHRVSTVRNADRIAVLHAGHIVEYGTHDELIARNGYYTDLYNKQLLEEELAAV